MNAVFVYAPCALWSLLSNNLFLAPVPSKPPQQLSVAKESSTSLFIHWRPVPRNHQNGKILGYRILYQKSNSREDVRAKNVSAVTNSTQLTNLTKFTKYDITILAYTSKGNGVRAKYFTVTTAEDRKFIQTGNWEPLEWMWEFPRFVLWRQ